MDSVIAFSYTEIGFNHTRSGKVCEDASGFSSDENMYVCAVADGHGSNNYPRTDRGSKYAVEAAKSCISDFIRDADPDQVAVDEDNQFFMLQQLSKSILKVWHQRVLEDIQSHPFEETELEGVNDKYKEIYLSNENVLRAKKAYGTTLIACAVTDKYSFGLQIGDGQCVVLDRNCSFSEPIPWDENCQMNVTTSICDNDAIDEFRYFISAEPLSAVFCGTDGIDDSYAGDEELYAFYRSILQVFIEHGVDVGMTEVKEYLPILTKRGSGDDVSIAAILDVARLETNKDVIEIQAQIYKMSRILEEKKHKVIVVNEKIESLRKKIMSYAKSGTKPGVNQTRLSETAIEIEAKEAEQLEIEAQINDLEKTVRELTKQLHGMLFDKEVASFAKEPEEKATFENVNADPANNNM